MDYLNLLLGSGVGILIASLFNWWLAEKEANQISAEKKEKEHYHWHDRASSELETLKHKMKLVIDRIDQHAGRIEKLESKKR